MTNLLKMFSLINCELRNELIHSKSEIIPKYIYTGIIDQPDQIVDNQASSESFNVNVIEQYTINHKQFENLDSFNDNQQLPLTYVDEYSLQAMGTALPDF